jgi:ERCC4-related helicase
MAPTKPLVAQQIEACHQVVGIPEVRLAKINCLFLTNSHT